MKHLITGVLVGALAAGMAAAPAEAAPGGGRGLSGGTALRLSLTFPTGGASGTRTVTLRCDPSGGNHPKAAQACADLAARDGAFDHEPAKNQVCPMIFRPVVAEAVGRWRGKAVRFRKQYGNDCVMGSRTGRVFAF